MKKINNKFLKIVPIIILLLSIISPIVASYNGPESNSELIINVKTIDEETLELDIYFPEFQYDYKIIEDNKYTTITLLDEGYSQNDGQANLPVLRRIIEIPYNSEPEIYITNIIWESISLSDLNLPSTIFPTQTSILKIPGALEQAEFIINITFWKGN